MFHFQFSLRMMPTWQVSGRKWRLTVRKYSATWSIRLVDFRLGNVSLRFFGGTINETILSIYISFHRECGISFVYFSDLKSVCGITIFEWHLHGEITDKRVKFKCNSSMYFAVGWPKYYGADNIENSQPCGFKFNRDRSILAVLNEDTLTLWYCRVSIFIKIIMSSRRGTQEEAHIERCNAIKWKKNMVISYSKQRKIKLCARKMPLQMIIYLTQEWVQMTDCTQCFLFCQINPFSLPNSTAMLCSCL